MAVLLAAITAAAVENARLHEESARLLEEVQQLQRTRERFFAMVNHELRNALAAVFGWAEMLVRKKDPATVPRAAFEVLDSAQQAIGLINDLLDLSRLDEDRLKPGHPRRGARRDRPPGDRPGHARRRGAGGSVSSSRVGTGLPSCETDASRRGADPRQPAGQRHPSHARTASTVRLGVTAAGRHGRCTRWTTRAPGIPESEVGADLRHLRHQGGRREPRRGSGPAALAAPGPAARRRAAGRAAGPGRAAVSCSELPAAQPT